MDIRKKLPSDIDIRRREIFMSEVKWKNIHLDEKFELPEKLS